jgi:DNA repair protein RecO (recombination protein O)
MYVNELAYRLAPKAHMDSELYGCYMSTLIQLNMPDTVHQTLRYFEMQLLSANGSAVDFNFDASNEPIDPLKSYNFLPNSGFVQKKSGRYLGSLITSAGNLDVAVKGAMAVARECMAQQLDALLGEQPLVSRQWRLPQRKEG